MKQYTIYKEYYRLGESARDDKDRAKVVTRYYIEETFYDYGWKTLMPFTYKYWQTRKISTKICNQEGCVKKVLYFYDLNHAKKYLKDLFEPVYSREPVAKNDGDIIIDL